jgi:tape measure domain-containing protein
MARTTASLNVLLALRTEGIGRALQVANKQLDKFARQAKAAGEQMTMSFTLPAAVIGGSAIKAFADMEKLEKSLTAVSGSSEEARAQLERLRVLALEPGLDLEQAAKATIRLQSVGYAASEAERTILQMSKAVTLAGGTADDLDEVVRQMTQMIGRGSILREDWNVIAERVPAINIALQDAFGTTNIEAIRETGISVKDFNDAVVQAISENEKFQAVQGGVANAFTNFQSAIRQALAVVGKAINDNVNLTAVMDKLAAFVNRVAEGFAGLSPRMQSIILGITALAMAIGPLLFVLGSTATILPTLTLGFETLKLAVAGLLSPITLIVAAIAAITAGAVKAYQENEVFRETMQRLGEAFSNLWQTVKDDVMPFFALIGNAIESITGETLTFGGAWQTTFAVFTGIINAIVNRLTHLVNFIRKIVAAATAALNGEFSKAGSAIQEAAQSFVAGINPFAIAKDFMDAYNEGIKSVPVTPIEQPVRAAGGAAPSGASGGGTGTGRRRPPVQELAALPSLAGQIQETGALALATQGAAHSAASMADAFRDSTDVLGNIMEPLQKTSEQFNWLEESLSSLNSIYEMSLDSLVKLSEQGELTLANFAKAVAGHVRQIIGLLIKEGVAAAVSKSLANPAITLNPALIPVIALGAGKLAQTAFNGILSAIKVPALATGGLAYGPTMALVGDNPGARSNPEVIAPLSKLQGMLEQSGSMAIGEFRLRGEDLLLAVTRTTNRQNRYK